MTGSTEMESYKRFTQIATHIGTLHGTYETIDSRVCGNGYGADFVIDKRRRDLYALYRFGGFWRSPGLVRRGFLRKSRSNQFPRRDDFLGRRALQRTVSYLLDPHGVRVLVGDVVL